MVAYTFYSPMEITETCNMIKDVVISIGGKIKSERDNVIEAKWRNPKLLTVFPTRFTFYVGKDMVLVNSSPPILFGNGTPMIFTTRGGSRQDWIWDMFIIELQKRYPTIDFGLIPGKAKIDVIKFIGDGLEQVYTSTSWSNPSWGGALLGGMLFGSAGAIIGGMGGTTYTKGNTSTRFSNEILASVRYTNGLTYDGMLIKNSSTYNEIIVNMSMLSK